MNPERSPLYSPSFPPWEHPLAPIPDLEEEAAFQDLEMAAITPTDLELLARLKKLEMSESNVNIVETDPLEDGLNPQNVSEKPLPPLPLFDNADESLAMQPEVRPSTPPIPSSSLSSSPILITTPAHMTSSPLMLNAPTFTPTPGFRRSPSPPRAGRNGSMTQTPTSQAGSFLTPAPAMVRAHSSPGLQSSSPLASPTPLSAGRSNSPLRSSPKRVRSPFRASIAGEEMLHSSITGSGSLMLSPEISSISEDAELEIFPRAPPAGTGTNGSVIQASATFPISSLASSSSPSLSSTYSSQTFPRPLRRRPNSPLRSAMSSGGGSSASSSRASSVPASPHPHSTQVARAAQKFNEAFVGDLSPATHSFARPSSSSSTSFLLNHGGSSTYSFPSFTSSSVPSTPTSARSRSPSISSLETIPDTPDAEVRAVEEDRREREERKRLWDQLNTGSGITAGSTLRAGAGFSRDKRKRWSVCGAEKRGDLNLETIWED